MPTLVLVRHCESSGPEPDARLTERGRIQAARLARFLAGYAIDALVASPLLRARQSIAPFADASGLAVALDARLSERWMAPAPADAWRDIVRNSFDDPDHRPPGGEAGREALARGRAAIEELLGRGHRLPCAVSHGQLIGLVLQSIYPGFDFRGWESLSNPDVYLLHGGRRLRFERVWQAGEG
jgi:2,3-bisphosphoglycerate-dependent phosphoglycerate mutase